MKNFIHTLVHILPVLAFIALPANARATDGAMDDTARAHLEKVILEQAQKPHKRQDPAAIAVFGCKILGPLGEVFEMSAGERGAWLDRVARANGAAAPQTPHFNTDTWPRLLEAAARKVMRTDATCLEKGLAHEHGSIRIIAAGTGGSERVAQLAVLDYLENADGAIPSYHLYRILSLYWRGAKDVEPKLLDALVSIVENGEDTAADLAARELILLTGRDLDRLRVEQPGRDADSRAPKISAQPSYLHDRQALAESWRGWLEANRTNLRWDPTVKTSLGRSAKRHGRFVWR